jgi:hypothetical protein
LACKEHDTRLYLESYQTQTNEETWRCPNDGCSTENKVVHHKS